MNKTLKKTLICAILALALAASSVCLAACGGSAVKSLTVRGQSEYIVGDAFAGATMTVVYENGRREQAEVTADMMSGFDTSVAGNKTVLVTYGGVTAEFAITVSDFYASAIAVTEDSVTEYIKGSSYTDGDARMTVMYTDGSTKTEDVTADMLMGFDTGSTGEREVTVTYGRLTANYEISVRDLRVTGSELNAATRTSYRVGDAFESAFVDVVYEDGSEATVEITDPADIEGFDTLTTGKKTVTVRYRNASVSFEIEVFKSVDRIELANYDSLYGVGDEFGSAMLKLTYTDGTTGEYPVTADMLIDFDTSTSGTHTVTVDFEGRQTVTFDITVAGRLQTADTDEESGAYKLQVEDGAYVDMSEVETQSAGQSMFENMTQRADTNESYSNGAEGYSTANISVEGNKIVLRFISDAAGKYTFGMRAQSGSGSGKSDTELSEAFSMSFNGGDKSISGTVKRATLGSTNWKDMTEWTELTDIAGELDIIEGLNTIELTFIQGTAGAIRLPNIDYFLLTPVA